MVCESKFHTPHWKPITQTADVKLIALTKLELFFVLARLATIVRASRRVACTIERKSPVVPHDRSIEASAALAVIRLADRHVRWRSRPRLYRRKTPADVGRLKIEFVPHK